MPKLVQAASLIALIAATSSAAAWYAAPYPAPILSPEQHEAIIEQQRTFVEQQAKAMEQAIDAQRQFAEQQAQSLAPLPPFMGDASFPEHPAFPELGQYPTPPEMPPMPEFGQYPEMPEMPEFGQYPTMPEMPAAPAFGQYPEMPGMPAFGAGDYPAPVSIEERKKAFEAYRTQAKQQMDERRAAMKAESERRRAMFPTHAALGERAPGMHRAMMFNRDCAPSQPQQAAAPVEQETTTE